MNDGRLILTELASATSLVKCLLIRPRYSEPRTLYFTQSQLSVKQRLAVLCFGETFEVIRCVLAVGLFVNLYQLLKGMNESPSDSSLRLSAMSMGTMKTILTLNDTI